MRIGILLALGLLVAFTVPSLASVREDQRACEYGYLKTLKKARRRLKPRIPTSNIASVLPIGFSPVRCRVIRHSPRTGMKPLRRRAMPARWWHWAISSRRAKGWVAMLVKHSTSTSARQNLAPRCHV